MRSYLARAAKHRLVSHWAIHMILGNVNDTITWQKALNIAIAPLTHKAMPSIWGTPPDSYTGPESCQAG